MTNTVIILEEPLLQLTFIVFTILHNREGLCTMLFNVELGDTYLSRFLVCKHILSQMGGRGGG